MDKQDSPEPADAASTKPYGLLRGLIDYLHELIILIASKLRHSQVNQSPMSDAKGDYNLWKTLGEHLEQVPVVEKHDVKRPKSAKGVHGSPIPRKNVANDATRPGPELNEIRDHNKQRAVRQQPRISQQLQSKTMEHINIALILAAEGNQDGVKLHIDLANNAMRTASRFMSHEEYEAFEEKVGSRVKSIVDSGRAGDSQR